MTTPPSSSSLGTPRSEPTTRYPSLFEEDEAQNSQPANESSIADAVKVTLEFLDKASEGIIRRIPDKAKYENFDWKTPLSQRIKNYVLGRTKKIPILDIEEGLLEQQNVLVRENKRKRLASFMKLGLFYLKEDSMPSTQQTPKNPHQGIASPEEPSSPTDSEESNTSSSHSSPISQPASPPGDVSPTLKPKKSPPSPPKDQPVLASPRPAIKGRETTYSEGYEEHPERHPRSNVGVYKLRKI